jgi:hypothetical protein
MRWIKPADGRPTGQTSSAIARPHRRRLARRAGTWTLVGTIVVCLVSAFVVDMSDWGTSHPVPATLRSTTPGLVALRSDAGWWAVLVPGQKLTFRLGSSFGYQRPGVDGGGLIQTNKTTFVGRDFPRRQFITYSGTISYPKWWCLSRQPWCSVTFYYYLVEPPPWGFAHLPGYAKVIR